MLDTNFVLTLVSLQDPAAKVKTTVDLEVTAPLIMQVQ